MNNSLHIFDMERVRNTNSFLFKHFAYWVWLTFLIMFLNIFGNRKPNIKIPPIRRHAPIMPVFVAFSRIKDCIESILKSFFVFIWSYKDTARKKLIVILIRTLFFPPKSVNLIFCFDFWETTSHNISPDKPHVQISSVSQVYFDERRNLTRVPFDGSNTKYTFKLFFFLFPKSLF